MKCVKNEITSPFFQMLSNRNRLRLFLYSRTQKLNQLPRKYNNYKQMTLD